MISSYLFLSLLVGVCVCQRPGYAGIRPIGYPDLETTEATTISVDSKLGFGTTTTRTTRRTTERTTERLPIEARGDRRLVEYLLRLPLDKQPFWLINWRIIEDNRTQPKTYPLKPNSYLHPLHSPQPEIRNPRSFQL